MLPRTLDLNLLRVFLAVHDAGGVSAAGRELALSQPAVSAALARLRDALGDPLFVRTPRGMKPTARADALAPAVRQALDRLGEALAAPARFDAARTRRLLRVALSDLGQQLFLPELLRAAAAQAPGLRFEAVPLASGQVPAALESREIDFALGTFARQPRGVLSETLFASDYVGLVRRGGRLEPRRAGSGRRPRLGRAALGAARIVLVEPTGTAHEHVARAVLAAGLGERIVVRVPSFAAVPALVEAIDGLAIVPEPFAEMLERSHALRAVTVPLPIEPRSVVLAVHARARGDGAIEWAGERIRERFGAPSARR